MGDILLIAKIHQFFQEHQQLTNTTKINHNESEKKETQNDICDKQFTSAKESQQSVKKRKMIRLGRYNRLIAFRETEYGWYLTDEDQSEEVLLPNKFVPKDIEQDQEIEVFIFNDSEDRATATTQKPTIELDSFGYLKVFDSSNFGAFMDMGLDRQLLVPFSEQRNRLEVGEWYIIFMYLDGETDRLVGSNKWMNYVEVEDIDLEIGQWFRGKTRK